MWTLDSIAAAILLLGLIMYAVFGGADFGGGIWTALASGARKREQREGLFHAIGPVWETNHVWLIFVVVVLFMVFPRAFSALFIALLVPLVIALVGINFRGAAFAFRHFGKETGRGVPFIARSFEISSILTPFFMGMAVTAAAAGSIRLEAGVVTSGLWAWITPFTIGGGIVGLAICAYLAPIFMTVRTRGELREDFRRRGMTAGLLLGALTTLEIPVAVWDAPLFAARLLTPRALACIALAVLFGLATELLLWRRLVPRRADRRCRHCRPDRRRLRRRPLSRSDHRRTHRRRSGGTGGHPHRFLHRPPLRRPHPRPFPALSLLDLPRRPESGNAARGLPGLIRRGLDPRH